MIKSIKLHNFQTHIDSLLEFENGINVISGSSNNGKSAIIKALNWVLNGEPSGNDIINYDKKECSVKLEINNNIIEKVKSEKVNKYIINAVELNAVGQTVPIEINDLTNFNGLNLQMQFDKFFLLQDSPGEVVRKLNKIIDLEIIDRTIKKAKSKISDKKRYIDNLELDILDLKKKIKKYDNLDNFENLILKTEDLENKKNIYIEENNKLKQIEIELQNYANEAKKYQNIEKKRICVNKLKKKINSYELLNNKLKRIALLKQEYDNNLNELENYKNNNIKKEIILKLKNTINEYIEKSIMFNMLLEYKENMQQIKDIENKIFNVKQLKSQILNKIDVCPFYNKICPLNKGNKK